MQKGLQQEYSDLEMIKMQTERCTARVCNWEMIKMLLFSEMIKMDIFFFFLQQEYSD